MSSTFNVEKYRDGDECSTSWNLRRRFLLAHHSKFPKNRLVCLAQCFVNVELYGNMYPAGVMIQLQELTKDMPELVEERKERIQSKYKTMGFVKASSTDSGDSNSAFNATEFPNSNRMGVMGMMGFVKSTNAYHSTDLASSTYQDMNPGNSTAAAKRAHFELGEDFGTSSKSKKRSKKKREDDTCVKSVEGDARFAHLRHHLKRIMVKGMNPLMLLNQGIQKSPMTLQADFREVNKMTMFECDLHLDGIFIATGEDRNKKAAKKMAYEKSIAEILKPYHNVVEIDGKKKFFASEIPFPDEEEAEEEEEEEEEEIEEEAEVKCKGALSLPAGTLAYESNAGVLGLGNRVKNNQRLVGRNQKDLDEMILVVHTQTVPKAPKFLRQSADFSKMLLELDYSQTDAGVLCRVTLEGQPLVECVGANKLEAKSEASENAVDLLKKMCWTIEIRQQADSDSTSLGKEELLGEVENAMTVIPDSNVGNQLLRKMGWVGGGVGKHGTGRAEPVTLQQVMNREGLGLEVQKSITPAVRNNIRMCVENYAKSDNNDDLVLSADFSKEERGIFHQHCKRFGMKSRSFGKKDNRYLIISRKRTPKQLFEHIMSKGGSTAKYKLIPPSSS